MNLFKKSKTGDVNPEIANHLVKSDVIEKSVISDVNEFGHARQCIEAFNVDLRESSDRHQSAIKRAKALDNIITKMELDVKSLRRLEHENRELASTVSDLETKLAQKSSWASELDSKLSNLDRRHNATREKMEIALADVATLRDAKAEDDLKIGEQDRIIRSLTVKTENLTEQNRHIEHTADKLRESVNTHSDDIARKNRDNLELQSSLEELTEKYERKAKQADATLVELKNLRLDFNELKAKHVELTGSLENTHYDLKSQKSVFEDTVKRREEEKLALKTRIDQLQTQIRIKENMATHLDQEFITLRNELVNERERNHGLESRLRQKSEEVERNGAALVRSKIEFDELNNKFTDMLQEFEGLRRLSQKQQEKLERYASIGGVTGGQVMLQTDTPPSNVDRSATQANIKDTDKVTVLQTGKTHHM